jgi:cytochrome c oxidase subunit 2
LNSLSGLPPAASNFAAPIDSLYAKILWISIGAFVLVQALLLVALVRFRERVGRRAVYTHGLPWLEVAWAVIPALILLWLAFASKALWAKVRYADSFPANAAHVEVLSQQFAWNIRYPGADGRFGKINAALVSDKNPFGVDPADADAKDDIIALNEMHLVEGKPVRLTLRSRDVIHSFFVPEFRFKQDAVPGSAIDVWFTPTRAGHYEIACAEFCGLAHYRMKGFLNVGSEAEHVAWVKEQARYR